MIPARLMLGLDIPCVEEAGSRFTGSPLSVAATGVTLLIELGLVVLELVALELMLSLVRMVDDVVLLVDKPEGVLIIAGRESIGVMVTVISVLKMVGGAS